MTRCGSDKGKRTLVCQKGNWLFVGAITWNGELKRKSEKQDHDFSFWDTCGYPRKAFHQLADCTAHCLK
jgi:hypothetical protein